MCDLLSAHRLSRIRLSLINREQVNVCETRYIIYFEHSRYFTGLFVSYNLWLLDVHETSVDFRCYD